MNKDVSEMVCLVREKLGARTSISTNGNVTWRDDFVGCGVDELVFSIDGARSASYRMYRDGDFNIAFQNMKKAAGQASRNQRIIWKYILFSHNDSNEELLEARKMADAIGVELQFVFTNAPNPSLRFRKPEDLETFWQDPASYPNPEAVPILSEKTLQALHEVDHKGLYIFGAGAIGLEAKRFLAGKNISVTGWLDSAVHKHNSKFDGLPVFSPDIMCDLNITAIIIGSNSYVKEISQRVSHLDMQVFTVNNNCL